MPGVYQSLSRWRSELMGLAALWVMLFHAYPFSFQCLPLDAVKQAGFAGVDIFILLSAMGLYASLSKAGGQISYPKFFLRRLVRILPAYWLVVGLYSLWLLSCGRIGGGTVLWNLSTLYYWFHVPDAFNWYIPAILAFYALAPLYARLLRRCAHPEWLTAAMFPVSYGIYRLSILVQLNYTEDFVCRIPAFALGMLMGRYLAEERPFRPLHGAVWAAGSLWGAVLTVLRVLNKLYLSPCYLIGAQLVPGCLLAAHAVGRWVPETLRRGLRVLGASSLEIYLLNVILTREFSVLAPYLDHGPRHLFYYAVTYSLNLLLGILLHRLLSRLQRRILPAVGERPPEHAGVR